LGFDLDRPTLTEKFPGQRVEFELAETYPSFASDFHLAASSVEDNLRSDDEVLITNFMMPLLRLGLCWLRFDA
jgi:hypothetical protein